MPKIGYGSNVKTKHMLPNGLRKMLVHNEHELEMLLMHNGRYAAEIASAVSARKRLCIIARAKVLSIKVTNRQFFAWDDVMLVCKILTSDSVWKAAHSRVELLLLVHTNRYMQSYCFFMPVCILCKSHSYCR